MRGINVMRVIAGGLLAGVIMNVLGVAFAHYVLGAAYVEAFTEHLQEEPTGLTIARHASVRLVASIVGVWMYAAIRPRFGPGPRTALIAALVMWLAAVLPLALTLNEFGILTGWRLWVTLPETLIELSLGLLAGAWVYREAGAGDETANAL